MLEIYIAALIFGGGLLAISSLFGGHDDADVDADADADFDHDVDVDHDLDADVDHDLDADVDHDVEVSGGVHLPAVVDKAGALTEGTLPWLPFLSMRFWVFGSAFFGLFGTLATLLGLTTAGVTLGASIAVGVVTGGVAATVIRSLREAKSDSTVTEEDWKGAEAQVLLPISPERAGKVRVSIRDRTLDIKALSEHQTLAPGDRALVVDFQGTHVIVEAL